VRCVAVAGIHIKIYAEKGDETEREGENKKTQ